MPNPGFWLLYLLWGCATWCACSYWISRWPVWGKEGIGIIVVWPPYALLLAYELWKWLWGMSSWKR